MATSAPSLAKATATARPIPESPPVTSARRPSSRPRPVYSRISSAGSGLISPAVPGYCCCCAGGGFSADGAGPPGCVVMVIPPLDEKRVGFGIVLDAVETAQAVGWHDVRLRLARIPGRWHARRLRDGGLAPPEILRRPGRRFGRTEPGSLLRHL